jgi:RNA polymerase sigma-70 factor (sigma-E family)
MGAARFTPRHGRRQLAVDEEFRQFATEFLPTLLQGAYLLLHDVDLAEDAVQGTLLRVFRRWDHARNAPEAYSRTALISVCRDHWRRQRRRPKEVLTGDVSSTIDASALDGERDQREALEQALAQLPQPQHDILVLRFYFDFSVADTARLVDVPEGTVKSATHRGLERLRDLLSPPSSEAKAC